ncbi:MAG: hypothetical protein RIS70_3614 [Planctomycetota bacterium]|jgi:putative glutamine amidotransferase
MKPPLIGITSYPPDDAGRYGVPAAYCDAVRRAGGIPVLVPHGEAQWQALLERLDGVIMAGGGDINPERYGAKTHALCYGIDDARDTQEIAVARWLVEHHVPTFAICRGMQVLNVALGGTLIQHLPDVVGETVLHRAPPRRPIEHAVELAPDSRLARMLGTHHLVSLSWHHQAVDQLGEGLVAVGRAADGVTEAVELRQAGWVVGVQWHPELTAATDPLQQRLFDSFIQVIQQESKPT